MSQQFISAWHIDKLGHEIREIRERALKNVYEKVVQGVPFDNELTRSRELLSKLFQWFRFEDCSLEQQVLELIDKVLQSKSGHLLVLHFGAKIVRDELEKIRSFVHPKFHGQIEGIFKILHEKDDSPVPPLQSEVPLSYRSDSSTICSLEKSEKPTNATYRMKWDNGSSFPWQNLIETDRHVLHSVEDSLLKPPQPAALLHSCEFFGSVLLHDFPAEIFLQRPKIVLEFLTLIRSSGSNRLKSASLICLYLLSKALQVRLNQNQDVCLLNRKKLQENERLESPENVEYLKSVQISLEKFVRYSFDVLASFLCTKPSSIREEKSRLTHLNSVVVALQVTKELLIILKLIIRKEIWFEKRTSKIVEAQRDLQEIFVKFGEILEYFRVESSDRSHDLNRTIYLILLHLIVDFLCDVCPLERTKLIFPSNLKSVLSDALIDVILSRIYSGIHEKILELVESFCVDTQVDLMKKYKDVKKICEGFSSTILLLKNDHFELSKIVFLSENSLRSLEFHKNFSFVEKVINSFSEKYEESFTNKIEDVVVRLLSYNLEDMQLETYKVCHKIILNSLGPKTDFMGTGEARILFLLSSKILREICLFGCTHNNVEIKNYSEDIVLYILKSKLIVKETTWNKIVQVLLEIFPLICCLTQKETSLGRTILNVSDPDTSKKLNLTNLVTLKNNIQLLFHRDGVIQDEAFSRIIWMLANQPNQKDLQPKLSGFYDTSFASILSEQIILDINKIKSSGRFYEPSAVKNLVEMLKDNLEPQMRRSALSQLSVMLEDFLLHQVFLDSNGLDLVIEILGKALNDKDFTVYCDSIIPIVSILKNLSLSHGFVRETLGMECETLFSILRGLLLYFTEDRMKNNATILLFLLAFKDFIRGSPVIGDLSLPELVVQKLTTPFICKVYWTKSLFVNEQLTEFLLNDKWCSNSLQIQWNCELFESFDKLAKQSQIDYNLNTIQTPESLQLSEYNLQLIQASSIEFSLEKLLEIVQKGSDHQVVTEALEKLSVYVLLQKIKDCDGNFLRNLLFKKAFLRFFKTLPSSEADCRLLKTVLSFLSQLVQLEGQDWIIQQLKDRSTVILDVLEVSDEESKNLSQELIGLITISVRTEQFFLDYLTPNASNSDWCHVVTTIVDNLKLGEAQHFYNLAYLDSLLLTLVHLTANLGWSKKILKKDLIQKLVTGLCELIGAFHSGKGDSAASSVMGLSITRHVLLILNHLFGEVKFNKIKNFEMLFLEDPTFHVNFLGLWTNRDVVVKAGALQLFAGLAGGSRGAVEILNGVKLTHGNIFEDALKILVDTQEACLVRENAAVLLGNLLEQFGQKTCRIITQDEFTQIYILLDKYDFYGSLELIFNNLFPQKFEQNYSSTNSVVSWSSTSSVVDQINYSTPGLVKSVVCLVGRLLAVSPQEISLKLQQFGLIKLIFRMLVNPSMVIETTKELSLYCGILEMNTIICFVLSKLSTISVASIGTILHTRDCLIVLISLLDLKIYHLHYPQLVYLRNKLWSDIFNLFGILLEFSTTCDKNLESLSIFCSALFEFGSSNFLECLCEALNSSGSNDLQSSALWATSNLFKAETTRILTGNNDSCKNIRSLLDSAETTSTTSSSLSTSKDLLSEDSSKDNFPTYRLLEEAYFKKSCRSNNEIVVEENNFVGRELCKILTNLYEISCLKQPSSEDLVPKKNKQLIVGCLTGLLAVSKSAKRFAFKSDFVEKLLSQLKFYYMLLSLDSVENLRKAGDRKRLSPVLNDLLDLLELLNNFSIGELDVKIQATECFVQDFLHKMWGWFNVQNSYLIIVLKLLATLTNGCDLACQSLGLTSALAGSGLKRSSNNNNSLLHVLINLISKEMDLISNTHCLDILRLAFQILTNCTAFLECRVILSKNNLLNSMQRLHPALTKKRKPWSEVEEIWLDFLEQFTQFPEGQACVAKVPDVLDVIFNLTSSAKLENRSKSLVVIRNLAFHQTNRPRLLTSNDFLGLLSNKLSSGSFEEKSLIVVIMWALAANNQKAKIIFKSLRLDQKLQDTLKHYQLCEAEVCDQKQLDIMYYVLSIIKDEKS